MFTLPAANSIISFQLTPASDGSTLTPYTVVVSDDCSSCVYQYDVLVNESWEVILSNEVVDSTLSSNHIIFSSLRNIDNQKNIQFYFFCLF